MRPLTQSKGRHWQWHA